MRSATPVPALSGLAQWLPASWMGTGSDDQHTRRVALLKRLLPAIGLALLLMIAMWPRLAPLWDRMRLGFPAIDLREARELRMVNPRYAGLDRLARPFLVTAATGRQVPDRQDLVSLEEPHADMKTHSGADIVVTAATGIYQSQAQMLDLFGEVTVLHQNGTRFVTDTARADVANNAAEGNDPVEGHGPSGDVKAQGFRITDKGDTIIFSGKSNMLLKGAKPAVDNSAAPAGLPPDVAAAAAHVERAAKPMLAAAKPAPAGTSHRPAAAVQKTQQKTQIVSQTGKQPVRAKATAKKT